VVTKLINSFPFLDGSTLEKHPRVLKGVIGGTKALLALSYLAKAYSHINSNEREKAYRPYLDSPGYKAITNTIGAAKVLTSLNTVESVKSILLMDALLDTIEKLLKTNKNFKDAFSNGCYIDLINGVQNTALAITALISIKSLLKA